MGYRMVGSSGCSLQSPIFQSFLPLPSSSSSPCCRPAVGYSQRRAGRRKASAVFAMKAEEFRDSGGSRRRALVLVGLSAIPFLQLPAMAAIDGLEKGSASGEIKEQDPQAPEGGFSPISILSEIGIIGSGVLGALYALSQKEKSEMELSIASMNTTLSEKEARSASLEVDFRRRLEKQREDHWNQVRKLKEEEEFLNRELKSAKGIVSAIGLELKSEKKMAEDLKFQIEKLGSSLDQSQGEKNALEAKLKEREDTLVDLESKINVLSLEIESKEAVLLTLRSNLSERESEIEKLTSAAEMTRSELEEAVSALTQLRVDHIKVNAELELKKSEADDLKKMMGSVIVERDEAAGKHQILQGEYDQLKSNFEEKSASDFELLTTKEEEVRRLEENLATALSQAKNSWELITELTLERESLKTKLEEESDNLKSIKEELLLVQQNLEDSKLTASDLSRRLLENEKVNEELKSQISRVKRESTEAEAVLKSGLEEAKSAVRSLSDELEFIKGALTKAQEELAAASVELNEVVKARVGLEDELAAAGEKSKATTLELERETENAAALNSELEAATQQREKLSKEKKAMESSLEEATRSLAEVNETVLVLTKELEEGKSVNAALQAEKEMLHASLMEQNNATREAQENIEDAQNVITHLGGEREKLEKKVKKFEEELAASKGEILRLRRQASLGRELDTEQTKNATETEPPVGESSVTKRTAMSKRRRAAARASQKES